MVPHLAGLAIEHVESAGRSVHVRASTCGSEAACPGCGVISRRVHSRYERKLADTASGGQEVLIHLQARRFFCGNGTCQKVTDTRVRRRRRMRAASSRGWSGPYWSTAWMASWIHWQLWLQAAWI